MTANFGFDYFNTNEMSYSNPYTGNAATVSGSLTKAVQRQLSYTFNQLVGYQRDFGAHALDIIAGHEYYELKQQFLGAQKPDFPLADYMNYLPLPLLAGHPHKPTSTPSNLT